MRIKLRLSKCCVWVEKVNSKGDGEDKERGIAKREIGVKAFTG